MSVPKLITVTMRHGRARCPRCKRKKTGKGLTTCLNPTCRHTFAITTTVKEHRHRIHPWNDSIIVEKYRREQLRYLDSRVRWLEQQA